MGDARAEMLERVERYQNKCKITGEEYCLVAVDEKGRAIMTGVTYGQTEIRVPEFVTKIGPWSFDDTGVDIVHMPKTVGLEHCTFESADLTEIYFQPDSILTGYVRFEKCTDLRKVIMPDTLKRIQEEAFEELEELTIVKFPRDLESIGNEAFRRCFSLKKVELPQKLRSIGTHAFKDCQSIEEIAIPDSVVEIGEKIFYGCIKLERMIIGRGVETRCEEFDIKSKLGKLRKGCTIYMTQGLWEKTIGDYKDYRIKVYK